MPNKEEILIDEDLESIVKKVMEKEKDEKSQFDEQEEEFDEEVNPITNEQKLFCIPKKEIDTVEKDPRQYALKKMVDLFSNMESSERVNGRKKLLDFSLWFIGIIFFVAVVLAICQGVGLFQIRDSYFLGLIGSILATITFVIRTISKYLFNDETDKILKTIEKIVDSYTKE